MTKKVHKYREDTHLAAWIIELWLLILLTYVIKSLIRLL